jgi:hypothetical protein
MGTAEKSGHVPGADMPERQIHTSTLLRRGWSLCAGMWRGRAWLLRRRNGVSTTLRSVALGLTFWSWARNISANTDLQRTVKFINDEASSVHGNLKVASIYTTESGEWKLGGFEVLSNIKDDEAVIYVCCPSATMINKPADSRLTTL